MKKLFVQSVLFFSLFSISCKKNSDNTAKPKEEVLSLANPDDGDYADNLALYCYPYSIVSSNVTWNIATCRSGCSSGIGFRCGRTGYVVCSNGQVINVDAGVSAACLSKYPQAKAVTGLPLYQRPGNGKFSFYDNGTVKLTFLSKLPNEEKNNNIFEIEEDEYFSLPGNALVGGKPCSKFIIEKGNYIIDKMDGEFGSVVFIAKLLYKERKVR